MAVSAQPVQSVSGQALARAERRRAQLKEKQQQQPKPSQMDVDGLNMGGIIDNAVAKALVLHCVGRGGWVSCQVTHLTRHTGLSIPVIRTSLFRMRANGYIQIPNGQSQSPKAKFSFTPKFFANCVKLKT